MKFYLYEYLLPVAYALDLLLGDPEDLPHPVRWMGRWIDFTERYLRRLPMSETSSGALLVVLLVAGTWLISESVIFVSHILSPTLSFLFNVIMIYYSLSTRSLKQEAMKIYYSLEENFIDQAKKNLSRIVGRDVEPLDEKGVIRATVETVAENLVDGVISPIFYAAIGGAPLAMAYKMVNTLDSMIGYKNERYQRFGLCAARLDDLANFIPARLSIVPIFLASLLTMRSPLQTVKTVLTDGQNHPSPNAGIPEASFSGALGIRLGGPNYYSGNLVKKPFIGRTKREIRRGDIPAAVDLMVIASLIWLLICSGLISLFLA
nr:cobalamin biosynthesis protein CobD [Desulfobacterales bacterium]